MKKHLAKTLFTSVLVLGVIALPVVADLYLLRGYVACSFGADAKEKDPMTNDLENEGTALQVRRTADGMVDFSFKNTSIFPQRNIYYRNDKLFNALDDTLLFALPYILHLPDSAIHNGMGYDCGTGLGSATINPLESFSLKKDVSPMKSSLHVFGKLIRLEDNVIYDRLHGDTICHFEYLGGEETWLPPRRLSPSDSIAIQFYLPTYSLFTGIQTIHYSNRLNLSYWDIIQTQRERRASPH